MIDWVDRNGVYQEGRKCGEELGGLERGKVIRIYCMRKDPIFSKGRKTEERKHTQIPPSFCKIIIKNVK